VNRDPNGIDGTKDPIYLLQRRDYTLTCCPSWLGYDGDSFWIEHQNISSDVDLTQWNFSKNGEIDERLLFQYLCMYANDDATAAVEMWITEHVFLTRKEAESYAKSKGYNYPYGYRIYCVSCLGELAKILGAVEVPAICA
jgi:hypothetical protein